MTVSTPKPCSAPYVESGVITAMKALMDAAQIHQTRMNSTSTDAMSVTQVIHTLSEQASDTGFTVFCQGSTYGRIIAAGINCRLSNFITQAEI